MAARTRIELGGVRWWLGRGVDRKATSRLLQAAMDTLRGGGTRNLKTGRRKQLYRLDLLGRGSPDHLLKVNGYRPVAGFRRGLRGSKARHELLMAEEVAERGIPTVVPLAAGERRSGGRLLTCYLLMPILEDAVDLRRLWLEARLSPRKRRDLVTAFGALTRQIHDAGVFQDDFAPNNFLFRQVVTPELFMIDFERAQLRAGNDEAARRFMLAKVDREFAGAPASDRMRFLRAYRSGNRAEARGWWHLVEGSGPALARRDFARMRRNATREGRRFRRLSHDAWRGYARVGVDEVALLEALPDRPASGAPLRVEAVEELWRVHYGGLGRSEGERIWVTANFLWSRGGLCPRPLGAWTRGDQTVLLLERRHEAHPINQSPDPHRTLASARVLLDRILALAEIREAPLSEWLLFEKEKDSALRVSLAAPHGVHSVGKPGQRRRERVTELIRSLPESSTEI